MKDTRGCTPIHCAFLKEMTVSLNGNANMSGWIVKSKKGLFKKIDFSSTKKIAVMVKTKFVTDFQINASKKMLFSYLSTASGLEDWFADEVRIDEDKNFIFFFDNEEHHARVASIRLNSHVKYDFFDPDNPDEEDHAFIEFKLEENELTQTMFLKVIDYSEDYDDEEMQAIWDGLVGKLKETIGG